MAQDPNGIFEDDEDSGLTEFGKRLVETTVETFREKVADSHDKLVEVFDAYVDQEIMPTMNEAVDDAVAELRKLMLLAVATISGQDKTREFVRKVAELARAGALSSTVPKSPDEIDPNPRKKTKVPSKRSLRRGPDAEIALNPVLPTITLSNFPTGERSTFRRIWQPERNPRAGEGA